MTPRSALRQEQAGKRSAIATVVFALVFIAWVGEWPVQFDSALYYGRWRSIFGVFGPLFTPIPGISLFPWQLLVIAMLPFCIGASVSRLHAREMDRAIFVSLACIAVTVVWGLIMGGSAYFAYHQVWRYLLALLLAYMLMSVIRTERDLIFLGKMVIIAALIRATLCIYHYWAHLRFEDDPTREYVTNHEDSMLFVSAIQITVIWAVLKSGRAAWTIAILVVPYVMYAIVLNDRRLAWVEVAFGLIVMYALIGPGPLRKKFNRWAMMAAVPIIAYVGAGQVSDSAVFAPVHALTSAGSYTDASALAREEEIRNLMRTLVDFGNPVTGTGWGRPYAMVERAYNNYSADWILAPYTPHNSLMGLAAYSGLLGIIGIWGVMPVAGYLATRGYRNSGGNIAVQTGSIASICAVCTYGIQCYGDIGLQSFPGAVFLATALATAGRVAMWNQTSPVPGTAAAPVRQSRMPRHGIATVQSPARRPSR